MKLFAVNTSADWQEVVDHLLVAAANSGRAKEFAASVSYKHRHVFTLRLSIEGRVIRLSLTSVHRQGVPDEPAHEAAKAILGERYAEPILHRVGSRHFYIN